MAKIECHLFKWQYTYEIFKRIHIERENMGLALPIALDNK